MAKKEVTNIFKIMATGGAATPAPPLGPVLGSKGVNPGQFVQKFNAATQHVKGKVVGCIVTVYSDRSFELGRWLTSTRTALKPPCESSKAQPARWASRLPESSGASPTCSKHSRTLTPSRGLSSLAS